MNRSGEEGEKDNAVQCSTSTKKRTSSFVGQMAQEIVHRMRTASFASQVAQDGFITSIQQDQCEESSSQIVEFSGTLCQKWNQLCQRLQKLRKQAATTTVESSYCQPMAKN
ncbi:hypothetical protein CEXT_352811 [Caerostris extrusa]|uniref:Uncharacterized protein n=1 Tax=Caerostris extrusa TaxID=172846 RepID=A0AAV4MIB3_CAEEX|nr:hypothetical protein CEXT_352811 [Caerostris extrusa]